MKNWKMWTAYGLLGLLMFGVISEKIIRAEWTLRHGTEFRCKVSGFDPPDFLRGRYVRIRSVPVVYSSDGDRVIYAQLRTGKDGLMQFGKKMQAAPGTGDYLKLRREWLGLPYGLPFTAFYLNEKRAAAVEKSLNKYGSGILTFRVWQGFAVPVSLEIGGVSVKEIR
jgi:hypothetical protein